jgi:PAS domain S-box-containing protein
MEITTTEAHRAIREGEFLPYFQAIVNLRTGQLAGFELLARWRHRQSGMIPPDVFIPLAERDGWIDELTQHLFVNAFTSARRFPRSLSLSVNVSPVQLRNNDLPSQIQDWSRQTGFSLDQVIIEITESALIEDPEQARKIAIDLKSRGCRLALDDFGTGYSSLRHLQSFPFDELKVDRSFVTSMGQQRESRKIVAAVVGLGQSLGLKTVAEGVEGPDQASMLQWLGCDMAQGWLCGRPVPVENLGAEIERSRHPLPSHSAFPSQNGSSGNLEGMPAQRLAHLQAIYDGAPVGLAFLDRELKHVTLNRQLAEINGRPLAEHLGRTPAETTPELFPVFEPYLRAALEGHAISGCEIRGTVGSHGVDRTFLASYQPAHDEAGEVVGVSVAVLDFTERKRAEERLKQYERLVEGLEEMIVIVDRDYRYVLANRSFLNYRELSEKELVGRLVPDVLGGAVFENVVKGKLDECFAGNVVKYDLTYRYPRLGERDLRISYFPLEVAGGVTGAACVLRDVTEMNLLARANQDWQDRIDLAQRSGLRIGLWDWNVASNTVVWSDETCRQWGFTPAEFSGRVEDAVPRIHPDDLLKVQRAIDAVLSGKERQYACQYRVVRPDGSICWIDASGVLVRDGLPHMVGVGIDVTHAKIMEQSLQESEERYRRAVFSDQWSVISGQAEMSGQKQAAI